MWIAEIVGVVLFAVAVALALLAWRRLRLLRQGGVDVALRSRLDESGRGWHLGIGRYRGDEFAWYRILSVRSGPDRIIRRDGLEISTRREPTGTETYAMPLSSTVLTCRATDGDVELAMGPDALTGFLSWLESAPPGRQVPWAS
ncbi:Protein of unknown function (DUF2550) [Streptoalloteichus tenebrarius]|uniref:Secreted protein n=1 Tax=Streptoalloteichus tenebrarius (strain ATCC 17920 / DSM 40477 / JCM 4838 / CBS 697.72 / NBRC 16177 / NCIMB 11028 / NRRL B-12390 / A12253. 1 / ISP 5477) TaxID=1933 RepID=A0ABT1HXQ5_STRSD|nr:DUF2550 domain-containing protein [Streptoalloteichus tenebrarius]MCP2260306.1 Protein of unknown function (DUF2550) [Streptoalloteichus tenebrarius]BFF03056.1 DUF2550 domain-containing protein [Streptoalloteichus tenebrarius]